MHMQTTGTSKYTASIESALNRLASWNQGFRWEGSKLQRSTRTDLSQERALRAVFCTKVCRAVSRRRGKWGKDERTEIGNGGERHLTSPSTAHLVLTDPVHTSREIVAHQAGTTQGVAMTQKKKNHQNPPNIDITMPLIECQQFVCKGALPAGWQANHHKDSSALQVRTREFSRKGLQRGGTLHSRSGNSST